MRLPPASRRGLAAALLVAASCAPRRPARPDRLGAGPGADTLGHALAGVVRDDQSDALVAGAVVSLLPDSSLPARSLRGATTDARGAYRLSGIPAGRYRVRIQRLGYLTETRAVQVGECGSVVRAATGRTSYCGDRKNFYLTPAARF